MRIPADAVAAAGAISTEAMRRGVFRGKQFAIAHAGEAPQDAIDEASPVGAGMEQDQGRSMAIRTEAVCRAVEGFHLQTTPGKNIGYAVRRAGPVMQADRNDVERELTDIHRR